MIKKIIVFAVLLISFQLLAQENVASPYSFFGLGDEQFKGTTENRSMGGLNVLQDSTHVNLYNPATLAGIKNTIFTIGTSYSSTKLTSAVNSGKATSGVLNYIAVAFPMGKFSLGFGLMPYSSVGFRLEDQVSSTVVKKYGGSGGINKIFFNGGYQLTDELAAGMEFGYNFGNIAVNIHQRTDGVQYTTTEIDRSKIKGTTLNFGLHYKKKLKNKLTLQSSMTYSFGSEFNSENSSIVYINKPAVVAIAADTLNPVTPDTKLKLASKFTIGAGIGNIDKWFVGFSFDSQNKKDLGTRLLNVNNIAYGKANKISLGGYYIPNKYSFSNYWKRITYRAGLRFENTGMIVNGIKIVDLGTSFGVGLPMGNARDPFSSFNIGVDLGKRGTTSGGLVKENYFNVHVGFTLNNKWFIKKKYN
jgi:hypothetical protein